MHDSWKGTKIRSNSCNYLWNQHVANHKIGDNMQPIGENKGFEPKIYDHDYIENPKSL